MSDQPLPELPDETPVEPPPAPLPAPKITILPPILDTDSDDAHTPEVPATVVSPAESIPAPTPLRPISASDESVAATSAAPAAENAEPPAEETAPAEPEFVDAKPKRKSVPVAAPKAPRKERYSLIAAVSALRALVVTFAAAVIVATIFMWFTSTDFLPQHVRNDLAQVQMTAEKISVPSTAVPTPYWLNRIGVVAGHSGIATYGTTKGNVDPGAVCPDNTFTEAGVVMKVAQNVVAQLQGRGYTADLLEEFDLRLDDYKAAAFISLHADSCATYDDGFNHSGFKVSGPVERTTVRDKDQILEDCIRNNYGAVTGLPYAPGEITVNMTNYHAFHESGGHPGIAPTTPGVILEVGLLSYDRDMLEHHTDKLADGVVKGLLCYLEPVNQATLNAPKAASPVPLAPQSTVSAQPGQLVPTPTAK